MDVKDPYLKTWIIRNNAWIRKFSALGIRGDTTGEHTATRRTPMSHRPEFIDPHSVVVRGRPSRDDHERDEHPSTIDCRPSVVIESHGDSVWRQVDRISRFAVEHERHGMRQLDSAIFL